MTDPGLVARWDAAVHDPGTYDLEVDTATLTPDAAAERVLALVAAGAPSAFGRLR